MEFDSLLKDLKKLNLPKNEFAIFGSGPLAIRGIRDSRDLDIIVKPELWNNLAKKYKIEKFKVEPKKQFIKIGEIEIYPDWLPWLKNTENLIDTADFINEVPYVKLKYVIKWKEMFNREKDKKDIELIEKWLKLKK